METKVDLYIVKGLIDAQFSEGSFLPIRRIESSGSDNMLFRLGDEWVIRLPRHEQAALQLQKEHSWLQKI